MNECLQKCNIYTNESFRLFIPKDKKSQDKQGTRTIENLEEKRGKSLKFFLQKYGWIVKKLLPLYKTIERRMNLFSKSIQGRKKTALVFKFQKITSIRWDELTDRYTNVYATRLTDRYSVHNLKRKKCHLKQMTQKYNNCTLKFSTINLWTIPSYCFFTVN